MQELKGGLVQLSEERKPFEFEDLRSATAPATSQDTQGSQSASTAILKSPKLEGAAEGISIAEPTGTHVGPLPRVTVFTDGVVPVNEGTLSGRQQGLS